MVLLQTTEKSGKNHGNLLAVFLFLPLLPPPLIFPLLLSLFSFPPILLLLLSFFLSFPPHCLIFLLLSTSHAKGSCFVRTDQLDGETDWKLRVAVPVCQALRHDEVSYTKMTNPLGLHPHTYTPYTHTHHTLHPPHLYPHPLHPHTPHTHHTLHPPTHTPTPTPTTPAPTTPTHTTPCTHHTLHPPTYAHHTHTHHTMHPPLLLRSSFTSAALCLPNTHTRTFTTSLADSQWCVAPRLLPADEWAGSS